MSDIALTIPTLEPDVGKRTCDLALAHTSLKCVYNVVHDSGHRGGVKTANVGLQWALDQNTPYICYMNDDVEIQQSGWLERLLEVLNAETRYCAVVPGGHCATAPQNHAKPRMAPGHQVVKHVSHFCIVHKRAALLNIGLFDEAFFHYACDNDWNLRAHKKAWKLVWVRDVWVNHWGCHPGRRQVDWMRHDQALYKQRLAAHYYD